HNNFTNGSFSEGGAVRIGDGGLVVTDSTLSGNFTTGFSSDGGAIYADTGAGVAVINSTLSGNRTSGDSADGGAVYMFSGDFGIFFSTLSGNRISGDSTEGGGAIAFKTSGYITIASSTLSDNHVEGTSSHGGGAIFTDDAEVRIAQSTITNNTAGIAGGIGFNADSSGESLAVINSIVAGNQALINPDFTAPGNAPGSSTRALLVISSLIGNNQGTTLVADANATFSNTHQSASFVGSNGAPIDPLLAPLADNGGRNLTHALLPGSRAIDHGENALAISPSTRFSLPLPYPNDQRLDPFIRIFNSVVDMGAFEAQPLSITGDVATLTGTTGRDLIVYRLSNRLLRINGLGYVLPANINDVQINGSGNEDTLNLIGTPDAETAVTGRGMLQVENDATHSGFDITGRNLEVIILDGQGGSDTVTFNDTAGDDKFFARPTNGFMIDTGGQFETDAFGFQMTGVFTTGNDLAKFFDAPGGGNDTLTARPTVATIQGTGFLHTAQNFDVLVASSRNGSDVANVFGTTGNDAFTGRAGIAVLSGTGFNYQLDGYATINANGLGGTDLVRFIGGPGNDSLTANPTSAKFLTGGFTLNTTSFERLIGIAGTGANDVAILNDSAGNDIFAGTVSTGELAGAGFFERTLNFDVIRVRGVNGGTNRRVLNNIAFTVIEEGTWV
ncbi:MAG: hypothetical protein KDA75_16120, partial [Planctomycetaceae bacterium]|nr:hypothetical protein [Planctomycetaceae bacterium]